MKFINSLKNLPIFSAIVPVLVLAIVIYFFLLPALKNDVSLRQQIMNKKLDLGVVQAPIKEYGALKEDISRKTGELSEMKKKLFWERDISKFLTELTRLASDLQIEFISLKPETMPAEVESKEAEKKDSKEPRKLSSVPIAVAFKSSYNEVISFLERIEEGQKFIRIDSLNIENEPSNIYRHLTKMKLSIFIEKGG